MRYNTKEENDGSLKVTIDFGTTEEQKKLQTAFLSFLESMIYMQKIFTKQQNIEAGDYKKPIIKTLPKKEEVPSFYNNKNPESYQELQKLEEDYEENKMGEVNELPNMDL